LVQQVQQVLKDPLAQPVKMDVLVLKVLQVMEERKVLRGQLEVPDQRENLVVQVLKVL
jgi:hypothetical protein